MTAVRPNWDNYFMTIAKAVATRGTCDRKQVGAVLVRDRRILATGYNGSPTGWPHCDEAGHELAEINGRQSCIRTIHAEENALLQAAQHGVSIKGATLYTTASTCYDCMKRAAQCGIVRIVYGEVYSSARSGGNDVTAPAAEHGIMVERLLLWDDKMEVPKLNPLDIHRDVPDDVDADDS